MFKVFRLLHSFLVVEDVIMLDIYGDLMIVLWSSMKNITHCWSGVSTLHAQGTGTETTSPDDGSNNINNVIMEGMVYRYTPLSDTLDHHTTNYIPQHHHSSWFYIVIF